MKPSDTPSFADLPDLMTMADVRRLFGVSQPTIRARIQDGSLPVVDTCFGRRILKSELAKALGISTDPTVAELERAQKKLAEIREQIDAILGGV